MFRFKMAAVAAALVGGTLVSVLPSPAQAATSTPQNLVMNLPGAAAVPQGYNRDLFEHWVDEDGDGCDTRSEVLQTESSVPVTFSTGCTVATGRWTSPYDGAVWTQASDVDIDHMVALSEAWASGAYAWTPTVRRAFANDAVVPYALIAVTDDVNSSKGDKDPANWMPPLVEARCQYLNDWLLVKYRWRLTVDDAERGSIQSQLNACPTVQLELPAQVNTSNGEAKWPLRTTSYDGTIYELVNGSQPVRIDLARWEGHYNRQAPLPAPTDYVRYPWSNAVYAVTFWTSQESTWLWQHLSLPQYQRAGQPPVRTAGWIKDSTYHQWATSSELFVREPAGLIHKLTYSEWQASGFRQYQVRANQGFQKLTWAANIAHMTSISAGQGGPITYSMWGGEALPSPIQVQRFPGDQFYKDACSDTVVYAGPTMNRAINYQEYVAAGMPQVRVDNPRPCAPPPPTNGPVPPATRNTCPSWAPIKGNADSGIYHVPGGAYYSATNPEVCFRSEADAVAHGYRRSQA